MKPIESNTKSRYQQIADELRLQIIQGQTGPGEKLPTFDDLVTMFDTSRSIVQMAIGQLRDQGFVRSDGRRGMFVADYPPHLYRYGILFPGHPGDAYWSRFNNSLTQEAARLQSQTPGYRFECYYDLNKNESASLNQLLEDAANHTLAGIIEMPFCDHVLEHPTIKHSGIPILYLFGPEDSDRLPSLTTDHHSFLVDNVMPKLIDMGAQNVATVSLADHPNPNMLSLIQNAGLYSKRSWIQYVSRDHTETIRRIVWLLFDEDANVRPDSLLVLDDNLLEHVMMGLADCNLQAGRDVFVFSQNNWPCDTPRMWPIQRFGVHTGQLLISACRLIEKMRDNQPIERYQSMPSWLEQDIPQYPGFDDPLPDLIHYEF